MKATAQPASAPSRYWVGDGAEPVPPSAGGRSDCQVYAPALSSALPSTSRPRTDGAVRAPSGFARYSSSVAWMISGCMARLLRLAVLISADATGDGRTRHRGYH